MKVLFLVNLPAPYRAQFFAELGKKCELTVIYERENASDRNAAWKIDTAKTYRAIYLKGRLVGTDNSFCPEIIRYLAGQKYDHYVIGMYSTYTAMLAITYLQLRKIPFELSTDGGFISVEPRIKYWIKKHFIGAASNWLSTSQYTDEYLIHYGAKRERIYHYPFTSLTEHDLYNARQVTLEDRLEIKKNLEIKERKIVLAVGQFIHRKGFDVLLRAFAKMNDDVGLYLVGGQITKEYADIINKMDQTRIHFIDFIGKNEIAKFYLVADAFVLPTREDIWGLVINEALSYGIPCVTTDRCGAGMALIQNGYNGFVVPVDDIEAVAEMSNVILTWDKLKARMNCFQSVKNYSLESMAQKHIEILKKCEG